MRYFTTMTAVVALVAIAGVQNAAACDGTTNATVVKRVPTAYLAPRPVPTSYALTRSLRPVTPTTATGPTTARYVTQVTATSSPNDTSTTRAYAAPQAFNVAPQSGFSMPAPTLQPVAPPATVARPAVTTSGTVLPSPATTTYYPAYPVYRPTAPVVKARNDVYYGKGIIGQPKLYVNGQPLRNALRWLTF